MGADFRTAAVLGLVAVGLGTGGRDVGVLKGQELAGWGRFLDPSGVGAVQVSESESKSLLTIFSGLNSTHIPRDPIGDAPRVMRPVHGAFAFQVHVSWIGAAAYKWPGVRTGPGPTVIVYGGANQYLLTALMYDTYSAATGEAPYELWTNAAQAGQQLRGDPGLRTTKIEGAGIWIRVERRGSQFRSLFGFDGRKWIVDREIELSLPDSIEIGFVVPNSTDSEMLGVFRSLEFDDTAVRPEDLIEDPYQIERRREERAGYLRFAGWLGGVGGVVMIFGLAVRLIMPLRSLDPPAQRLPVGAAALGYLAAFVTTMLALAVVVLPGASYSYMGNWIGLGILMVAAPFVALWTLAWLPVGSRYLALVAESQTKAGRLMTIVGLGALVAGSPGVFLWFVLGYRDFPLVQIVAATAAGGVVYLLSLRSAGAGARATE